jgi:predicted metal-dependent phosphoesterase TrpH
MTKVDLHVHSTCSDGLFPPEEVVRKAAAEGVTLLALADHDSITGVPAAIAAGAAVGVNVIAAVELSVEYLQHHDVHLLGYGIDATDARLSKLLASFQKRRDTRGERIVERINEKLKKEGRNEISVAAVRALAEGALGRPHIARVLMEAGYVKEMEEAFRRYLEPCNVPKEYFPVADAIAEIHRLGGVAVLAHPQSVSDDRTTIRRVAGELKTMGLDGIETHNTMGTANDAMVLERLAMDLGLLATGGSDFHGFDDDSPLGTIRGVPIPAKFGTELLVRLNRQQEKR